MFQIEPQTRQWLGTLAVGGVIGTLIITGKIPAAEYKHWEGLIIGGFLLSYCEDAECSFGCA